MQGHCRTIINSLKQTLEGTGWSVRLTAGQNKVQHSAKEDKKSKQPTG